MPGLRTAWASSAALIALLALPWSTAASEAPLRAEVDYRLIRNQPSVTSGVEVIDFFWYGCPHCRNLQPSLNEWIRNKPADVTMRRIPAILRDSWAAPARIYYTLEALGEVDRLHQQVYLGYHDEKLRLSDPQVVSDWAARHGIDRAQWDATYQSDAVSRKTDEAARLTRAYDIRGTPSLVVNGHYLTSGNMAESLTQLVTQLDQLVRMARERAASR